MQTQRYVPKQSGAKLVVLEQSQIRVYDLDQRNEWMVGRIIPDGSSNPDVPFHSWIVSRRHGWLKHIDQDWYYVDNPENLNGTFLNGIKIERNQTGARKPQTLTSGDVLRIDNQDLDYVSKDGILMLFTKQPVQQNWSAFMLTDKAVLTIGRSDRCDIIEPYPYVSATHAKITSVDGQFYLSDCGSMAGTYLNGKRAIKEERLRVRDHISICDRSYFFLGDRLLFERRDREQENNYQYQTAPNQRPVVLQANIKTKKVKNNSGNGMKELIRDIHLEIRQETLVALLGTAGAGKSTVMNCLNGMDTVGVQGSVIYRGVDLMKNFDQMKHLIGSVPQKKIIHKVYTPEFEFWVAAQKRLPADLSKQEIQERVDQTLEMLSMNGVRKNRNSKLSGGEQTRVNVGIELVADRDLLCLDEPDQGLSPNYKHELFEILRSLAHNSGKSVLSIIHDVSEIDLFDQVIMLAKVDGVGRLAFSGTPKEAREYFGVDIHEAYALLEKNPERFVR